MHSRWDRGRECIQSVHYPLNILIEWVNGGVTSCRHLRPYSGWEHTVFILIEWVNRGFTPCRHLMPSSGWETYIQSSYLLGAPPREYHGIYIHIGEESYFKVGARFATSLPLRTEDISLSVPYVPFPSIICDVHYSVSPLHGDCLSTVEARRCNLLPAKRGFGTLTIGI